MLTRQQQILYPHYYYNVQYTQEHENKNVHTVKEIFDLSYTEFFVVLTRHINQILRVLVK